MGASFSYKNAQNLIQEVGGGVLFQKEIHDIQKHRHTKSHMGRKQEDAYLPNIKALSRVTSNPYYEFNFKKIFTKTFGKCLGFHHKVIKFCSFGTGCPKNMGEKSSK